MLAIVANGMCSYILSIYVSCTSSKVTQDAHRRLVLQVYLGSNTSEFSTILGKIFVSRLLEEQVGRGVYFWLPVLVHLDHFLPRSSLFCVKSPTLIIGASLSQPHTGVIALQKCVCIYARTYVCLFGDQPLTVNSNECIQIFHNDCMSCPR